MRNRWVLATTVLMAASRCRWCVGSAPTGTVKIDPLAVTVGFREPHHFPG